MVLKEKTKKNVRYISENLIKKMYCFQKSLKSVKNPAQKGSKSKIIIEITLLSWIILIKIEEKRLIF